jgi:hypothetical protein
MELGLEMDIMFFKVLGTVCAPCVCSNEYILTI